MTKYFLFLYNGSEDLSSFRHIDHKLWFYVK